LAQPSAAPDQPEVVAPAAELCAQRGDAVEQPAVRGHAEHAIACGDEPLADVAHEDGQLAVDHVDVDDGVVDDRGRAVHDPGPPDLRGSEAAVAGDPHDPVVLGADPFAEPALSGVGEPLERRARLRIGRLHLDHLGHDGRRSS
jgi:hypothetical protein